MRRDDHVLVAGVGNIFLGDDGFGSEVARRLATRPVPYGVRVADYGIGGIHLAYDLLGGVDLLVLVDALPRGRPPGTVSLVEVDRDAAGHATVDSHAMDPATVFATLRGLGGTLPPTVVVGCEPADVSEGIGLSPAVEAAVEPTVDQVLALLAARVPAASRAAGDPPSAVSSAEGSSPASDAADGALAMSLLADGVPRPGRAEER